MGCLHFQRTTQLSRSCQYFFTDRLTVTVQGRAGTGRNFCLLCSLCAIVKHTGSDFTSRHGVGSNLTGKELDLSNWFDPAPSRLAKSRTVLTVMRATDFAKELSLV